MISDLVRGIRELDEAYPCYEEAEVYAEGQIEEVFATPRIRALLRATGQRYRFRLARKPIDALANRVQLVAVSVPNDKTATGRLAEIWDANDLDVELAQVVFRAFEYGDAYLMVWPYEDDPDSPVDDPLAAAGVEVVYNSPKSVRIIYDPEHSRRPLFAIKRWKEGVDEHAYWRADLYYPDAIERYISRVGAEGRNDEDWVEYVDNEGDAWPEVNPFGEIPFFHFRTAMPYGRPEHIDAYGPQDAINKTLITQLTTMDAAGWPERYALSEKGAALDEANDAPRWDDEDDADNDGEPAIDVAGPGGITTFHGMSEVGQFDPADPSAFIKPTELYVRLMAVITDTPLHEFDPSGEQPSGESRRVAEAPLVAKAHSRIRMFRSPALAAFRFVQKCAGMTPKPVDVRWAAVESVQDKDGWEVVDLKQRLGVPQDQTLREAGYTEEQVAEWTDADAEAMSLLRRIELLGKLGAAVRDLGTGVALGIVSQEDVNRIVGEAMAQTEPEAGAA